MFSNTSFNIQINLLLLLAYPAWLKGWIVLGSIYGQVFPFLQLGKWAQAHFMLVFEPVFYPNFDILFNIISYSLGLGD